VTSVAAAFAPTNEVRIAPTGEVCIAPTGVVSIAPTSEVCVAPTSVRSVAPWDNAPTMQLTVNGKPQTYNDDPEMPLLWYLRDDLRLTGTRFGCGAGLCGACTVHVNGQAVRSCQTRMGTLESKTVLTIDALAEGGTLHPVQRAWIQHDVPQCGYCQSGQIMSAVALLKTTPNPTDAQIDAAMAGNICRCGTYQRIRAAIKTAAKERA